MLGKKWACLFIVCIQCLVTVGAMGGGPIRGDKLPKLISMAEITKRGVINTYNDQIIEMMNTIADENIERSFSTKLVEGSWELLWTTEKETLFFAKNGLFGKPVRSISQTIDISQGSINNLIEFDGDRAFSVTGSISCNPETKQGRKLDFMFQSATLAIPPLPALSIPPVGKGWFENIYCNQMYRLSRDVRGDYLISRRKT